MNKNIVSYLYITLDMSILKRVPNRGYGVDAQRQFFIENTNSNKYYYMPVGDVPQNPNRNTLVPLGTFLGFINFNGQMTMPDDQFPIYNNGHNQFTYRMRFSNPPYNAENGFGAIGMDSNTLVYTDEPPAAGSVPLHYYDYVQMANGTQAFDENGRPMNNEHFPTAFGDGENGWGVQTFRPPGYVTEQSRNSTFGSQNFVAKKGGKTQKRKNRKTKKTRKYKRRRQKQ